MLAILNFLNAHNLPIFQPILMILVSKFMVHRALSDTTYLSLGLLPPLTEVKLSISTKSIIFQGSRGGPTFSRGVGGGGVHLFPGGV